MSVNSVARLTSRDRDILRAVQDHALVGFAPLEDLDRIDKTGRLATLVRYELQ